MGLAGYQTKTEVLLTKRLCALAALRENPNEESRLIGQESAQ